jgi:superfamily II DNA or RNA helicase/Holliday junction resolvase
VTEAFLGTQRLLLGPWQALERDVARLLVHLGFEDVRIVAGSGDHGADVLAVRAGLTRVIQCKHTSGSGPPPNAVEEVVQAAQFYEADRMAVATSRPVGPKFKQEVARFSRQGLRIDVWEPAVLRELVSRAPKYAPTRRTLRPYQVDAVERLRDSLLSEGKGLVVLATGLGKTVVMAELVAEALANEDIREGRVLVLADKRELISQLQIGFWAQLPKTVPTHMLHGTEKPAFWDGITFATVQSASTYPHLPYFDLVLVDEAHHAGSITFQETLTRLAPRMVAGVTATPWRGDGFDLARTFGEPLVRMGISDGLREGYLSEVDYQLMADDLDWQLVQDRSQNSYALSQLNRSLIIPTRDEEAAGIIAKTFRDENRRGGVVFSPSLSHAREFAGQLRGQGLRAEAIGSDDGERAREKLMTRFRKGAIDVMTTVDLFNEGVDVPDVDLIAFMRVTHSRRIFVQQLGRGLRLSPGKDRVIVLDFVTDLRRIAEVVELEAASRAGPLERISMGPHVVNFRDASTGDFLMEWVRDQADLLLREDDPLLQLPQFEFPEAPPGTVA